MRFQYFSPVKPPTGFRKWPGPYGVLRKACKPLRRWSILGACWLCLFSLRQLAAGEFFEIQVVDAETHRGVPLVELKTVNGISLFTDSAGRIAFFEPGLMDRELFFTISSPGYEFPANGLGIRGKTLHPNVKESVTLELTRKNLAERLYRVTGAGIYRDSLLLNRQVPLKHPDLNAGVMGSDSVLCAPFQGKLYWFWGDTPLARSPLGLFHAAGATSPLPGGQEVLEPERGVDLTYFVDATGTADNMARMPGEGPTWLSGLTVLKDENGTERMFAGYAKIKPPMEVSARGIAEFNTMTSRFEHRVTLPTGAALFPDGHTLRADENGVDYVYFARPFPNVRVRARIEDFLDVNRYESYSCLKAGTAPGEATVLRNKQGDPEFAWRTGAPAHDWKQDEELIKSGQLSAEELPLQLRSFSDGKRVLAHSGSVCWNPFRKRYVMIALEIFGSSPLGEIWYAETDRLPGPWSPARKIVSHENVSFYNPLQHPEFSDRQGRFLYFEGTYSHSFSGSTTETPRYEYNQLMYRLDLTDQRLQLPPVERPAASGL